MGNKVVLITGASSGFGKLYVQKMIEKGHVVYAAARRVEKMEDLRGLGANILAMDVTSDRQVNDGVSKVVNEQGRIDILVNNAGYGGYGMLEAVSMEEAHFQFEVNVFGVMRLVKAVLPYMREKRTGVIINMSSVMGKISSQMVGWYGASKKALEGLTDTLRSEVKRFGIKVVLIEPGAMRTGFEDVALNQLSSVEHHDDYHKNVTSFVKNFKKMYAKAPGPEAVVKTLIKAGESKRPRIRYAVGIDSKVAIFMHKLFPDRITDSLMRMTFGVD